MKVLNVNQIRELDQYTITHEPIPSIDLMERAAVACADWILDHFASARQITVFSGNGNNGGDGLAIARLLAAQGWNSQVIYLRSESSSEDYLTNLRRLKGLENVTLFELAKADRLPRIPKSALVIDALFGSGLSRPIEGTFEKWVRSINRLSNVVISIDIPSGVYADQPTTGIAVQADFTLSFEVPKLALLIPENQLYIGEWVILPIGLDEDWLSQIESDMAVLVSEEITALLKPRRKFDHKGTYGHALIIAGSQGKAGAAILASKAALRSGAGLVTAHVPESLNAIVQSGIPEAMTELDTHPLYFTGINTVDQYSAIGIGCGLGTEKETISGFKNMLRDLKRPMVIDADALNILAAEQDWISLLPANSVLTPHFKEFERLFGASTNHFDRLEKLREAAMRHNIIIVLKGSHTAVASADGKLYFNNTGNPGMATAGSGDVLTGIITGLLAQKYSPLHAALLGVWMHGLAGDYATEETGYEALIASDIIAHLGTAFKSLWSEEDGRLVKNFHQM